MRIQTEDQKFCVWILDHIYAGHSKLDRSFKKAPSTEQWFNATERKDWVMTI
jgi:hypothetical protein